MIVEQLPRMMLAIMFLSIAALGYSVNTNHTEVTFVSGSYVSTFADG